MSQCKNSILNILCQQASKSHIDQQLSAAIMKSNKLVSKPLCNAPRNTCRGAKFGSLHAETNAILNYFGKNLSFDRKKGWCFLSGGIQEKTKT